MTPDEKVKAAADKCRERAATSDPPEKACLLLYADILPILVKWEEQPEARELNPSDYLTALIGVCVTLAAHAIRNAVNDDPVRIDMVGPQIAANFSKQLYHECHRGEIGAVLGKLDS